jgi:hypothetical protein
MSNTELAGKTFTFRLPDNDKGTGCKMLKNEESFIDLMLKLEGCRQVENVNVCGIYAIHFDADVIDTEIIHTINEIADRIGFEDFKELNKQGE